jgi:hypothetical protein
MKTFRWLYGVVAVALMLVGVSGSIRAQDSPPLREADAQAALGTAFTYQGRLR